ncbi:hypothetical protein ACHAW5_010536 [Stephanodiscus triporus]|uniref:Uncharacterized protein n=1 Tax=Stephanodiscus triporus TaxID=2934178 RepID=A0ABD3P8I9_9STRA
MKIAHATKAAAAVAVLAVGSASAFAPPSSSTTTKTTTATNAASSSSSVLPRGVVGPGGWLEGRRRRSSPPPSSSSSSLFAADGGGDGGGDADWSAPRSAMIGGAGVNNAGEPPFEIRGFSLGNLVVAAGLVVTALSFAEYLGTSGGGGGDGPTLSGLGFVYGIPIFLAGAALKYAEIEPVPCVSSANADALFEAKATEIMRKIKQDVTRHRYGDEAHLDTTVKKLGLVVPGKSYPQLQELRQDVTPDGELSFTMVWQSLDTPYKLWAEEKRRRRYETFFGPGVGAEVVKVDAERRMVGIRLTTGGPLTEEYLERRGKEKEEEKKEVVVGGTAYE